MNETDIGSIHVGQKVRFTVSALPRDTFEGKVSQVRMNASMTQSVVTYTVVVAVDNSAGRLLPYLTARLQFEVDTRKGVLTGAQRRIRWQPDTENILPNAREQVARVLRGRIPTRGADARTVSSSRNEPIALLWIRQGDFVRPIKVRTGLSDGLFTEIFGDEVAEGMEIVVGANRIDSEPDALSILPHTWSEPPKK